MEIPTPKSWSPKCQTIKKVSSDYESLKYNTAIAAMMTLVNEFTKPEK